MVVSVSTQFSSNSRHRLRNWAQYNAALVQRGSLTVWCDEAAVAGWVERGRTGRRGRPRRYSDDAITCMLLLQTVFRLPLRATVGFVRSLLPLLQQPALPVADASTLSRRRARLAVALPVRIPTAPMHLVIDATGLKLFGEGEWKVRQHGWCRHRRWLKLHIAVDVATQELRAAGISTNNVTDGEMLPRLLAAEPAPLAQVTGDGAYDEWRCWDAVAARPEQPRAVFPVPRPQRGPQRARVKRHGNRAGRPLDRDEQIRAIRHGGRAAWKRAVGYHQRSLAETAMSRLKGLFGDRVAARSLDGQVTEVLLRCAALNRMSHLLPPRG